MSKKKTGTGNKKVDKTEVQTDYYDLHREAIDDLVNATEENSPEVSEEEIAKYTGKKLKFRGGPLIKAILIKWWFAGCVCFLFLWGLGLYIHDMLDQLFILGLAGGVFTDLLVNNVLRFTESTRGANDKYMMFPSKRYRNFIFNIIYSFVILFFVVTVYAAVNAAAAGISGATDMLALGVEPVLYGALYTLFDMLFIKMKNVFAGILNDAKEKASRS
ncbi:MAG: hypothetical protein ILP17_00605 [Lachnospiraceae bacterium]|nr:hypothetical protein [Lachnospiraceae bacterium]